MTTKTAATTAVHLLSRRFRANEAEAALQHVPAQIGIPQSLAQETDQNLAPRAEREDVRQVSADRAVASEADQREDLHMRHEYLSTRKET